MRSPILLTAACLALTACASEMDLGEGTDCPLGGPSVPIGIQEGVPYVSLCDAEGRCWGPAQWEEHDGNLEVPCAGGTIYVVWL